MSDRQVAKNRWHKGVSAYVRTTLRKVGLSLDEEATQFALGGRVALTGESAEYIASTCDEAIGQRRELMAAWESEHPGRNPYPPSFPERCLALVRDALQVCNSDEGNPVYELEKLKLLCERELELDPTTIETPDEE